MNLFNSLKKKGKILLVFFAVLGPGIITAIADNDAGGIATYSVAASLFGYASQFMLILITLLLAVTQEVGARISIVTRKGLGDLIRERLGIRWALLIFVLLFITNQGVVIQDVTGLKSALDLMHLPYQIFLPFIIGGIWLFLLKGNYKSIQRGFLLLTVFYFAYLISAIEAKPDWKLAVMDTIWPTDVHLGFPFFFAWIAVLGTTITAWGQFFISSYIRDKGIQLDDLKFERIEVYVGAIVTNFFSFMIVVAVAATLFKHGIHIATAQDAALAIRPFAGDLAFALFSYGLFVASILGSSIVPLATAYAFSEFFGFERSLNKSFSQSKLFYIFLIVQLFFGFFVSLFPNFTLFKLTLYADFLNGAMLPVIFFFLIKFANDRGIMGRYVNSKVENIILGACTTLITIAVLITFIGKFFFGQ